MIDEVFRAKYNTLTVGADDGNDAITAVEDFTDALLEVGIAMGRKRRIHHLIVNERREPGERSNASPRPERFNEDARCHQYSVPNPLAAPEPMLLQRGIFRFMSNDNLSVDA